MRIVLLGPNGQLGFELKRAFAPMATVLAFGRESVDLSDADGLAQAIRSAEPQVILNAAAYTQVDRAEDEPERAALINHHALRVIGETAASCNSLVVHFSTDYVFAGGLHRPYLEDDPIGAQTVYGRTKAAGEAALRESNASHLIFRTAWVNAARGHNFVRTMLALAPKRQELRIVNDQVGSPTPARWLAAATSLAVMRWQSAPLRRQLEGTYHLSAAGQVSWFEFAQAIFARSLARGLLTEIPKLIAISSAEHAAKAARPLYSVLDNQRFKRTFHLSLPDWGVGLEELLEELTP